MNALNTVSNHALPALVDAAPRLPERSATGAARIEPVTAVERARLGSNGAGGQEPIRLARDGAGPATRFDEEPGLRLVSMEPEAAAGHDVGAASLWFLAQVYGQRAEPARPAVMDGHRDAPQIGTEAYRRADAVSGLYPEQATVFSFDV